MAKFHGSKFSTREKVLGELIFDSHCSVGKTSFVFSAIVSWLCQKRWEARYRSYPGPYFPASRALIRL